MKRALALILALVLVFCVFSACQKIEKAEEKTVLRLNLASEPDYLDPALNSSVDGACLAINSFSGLYMYDDQGALVPACAESYTVSEDGMTYTFTLKNDLKWSDGSALTAADFAYAWKRAADPATASDYSYMLNGIAGFDENALQVSASEDGKTFTVVLKAPCAYFLDLCAFPTFLPIKQSEVEKFDDWQTNPGHWCQDAGFISNGAYVCKSWTHDESMVYEKNPNYWDAANVKIDTLELMLSADDVAIKGAYDAGNLDFIDTVPTDEIQALLTNPEFFIAEQLGTYYVCFNAGSPLFDGKTPEQAAAMRLAISYLIDRPYIAENIGQTGQKPANAFIPEGMMDGHGGTFKANDADYTYPDEANAGYYDPNVVNVDKAIELLESAGYTFESGMLSASTPITFEYLVNDGTGHIAIAEAMQQDFAAIGITMTIKTVDWNVFLEERKSGNFDVARNGWVADFNDPINMLEMWTTDSGNNDCQFGKTDSAAAPDWAEYDSLIAQIKSSTDFTAREALMHQAEDILMGTGCITPIYYYNDIYMLKSNVTGIYANLFGYKYFMYADVAPVAEAAK